MSVNGIVQYHFSDAITSEDTNIFGVDVGYSEGQQLWEALAMLVAIRLWAAKYPSKRTILAVKSDNVGALTLMIKLRPKITSDGHHRSRDRVMLVRAGVPSQGYAHARHLARRGRPSEQDTPAGVP